MQAAFPPPPKLPLENLIDYSPLTVAAETTVWQVIALMNQCKPKAKHVLVVENRKVVGLFSLEDVLRVLESDINLKSSKITEVMITSLIRLKYSHLQHTKLVLTLLNKFKDLPLLIEDEREEFLGYITPENINNFVLKDYQFRIAEAERLTNINKQIKYEILPYQGNNNIENIETLFYLKQAIESSIEGIVITDITGNIIYSNSSFTKIFNYTREELNAKGGLYFLWKEIVQYKKLLAITKKRKLWCGQIETKSGDGNILYIKLRTSVWSDISSQIIGMISIHTNVTNEVKSEEALCLKNKAINAISNGIVIFELRLPSKPIIYRNPDFKTVTSNSISEALLLTNHFIEDMNNEINKLLKFYFESDGEIFTPIIGNSCKDGSKYWHQQTISPILNREEKLTNYVCIKSDITNHKQTEMSLLLTQEKLKHLFLSSTGVIYSSDFYEDYSVTFISDNIVDMIGYEVDEILCHCNFWVSRIHPEDLPLFIAELPKVFAQDKVCIEYRFRHKNGHYIWIYEQSRLVKDYNDNPLEIIGYRIDISERKLLEEDLKKILDKEKELNELKSRFISMTSHEFRTPLSTILSSSELLENYRHKWEEEKQFKHFNRIKKAVKHMTNLLNDVLFFGKAEVEKVDCNPAKIDLVAYSRQLVEELQINQTLNAIHKPSIKINFITDSRKLIGFMDEKILEHIFNNLLSNAIKYSNPGGTINFSIYSQKERVIFEIQDEGIGIPSEDLPSLFESFHRCTNVGNIPGTGLGLSIVRKCVDIHNGEIKVASEIGVGTKFTISFPLPNFCK